LVPSSQRGGWPICSFRARQRFQKTFALFLFGDDLDIHLFESFYPLSSGPSSSNPLRTLSARRTTTLEHHFRASLGLNAPFPNVLSSAPVGCPPLARIPPNPPADGPRQTSVASPRER